MEDKLRKREIIFTIVGLGRIGQPTAAVIANEGFIVYGLDINTEIIKKLKSGIPTVDEPGLSKLLKNIIDKNLLRPTIDAEEAITSSDVIIICLPTPVSKEKTPDYSAIIECFNKVSKYIKKGSLIIIESTVSPGTVENLIIPLIERNSNLKVIEDFGIASCPERSNPGEIITKFKKIPRIIGGINKKSTEITATIYKFILGVDLILVSNPKTANAVKLTENIFRDVNIALMNELAVLFEKLEIDIFEIINAASTKWNFVPHFPGSGVGGPCLPSNPYYLIQEAIKVDYVPHLIRMAREINDRMPHYMVELVLKSLNIVNKAVNKSNICILGISYKADIGDYQISPAFHVIDELIRLGGNIKIYDPFFKNSIVENYKIEKSLDAAVKDADCLVIITDHTEFKKMDLNKILNLTKSPLVIVDGRNTLDPQKIPKNIVYKSLGRLLINKITK